MSHNISTTNKVDCVREIVVNAFHQTIDLLVTELKLMPLERWNEAVLRYYFSRCISVAYPNVGHVSLENK